MNKRPYLHFGFGMGAYVVLLFASIFALQRFDFGVFAYGVALLPVIALAYGMFAIVIGIRKQDELIRRMHLESVLITALLTGGWTFSWGLLESAGLVFSFPVLWVAPIMIGTWGIVNGFVKRQYE